MWLFEALFWAAGVAIVVAARGAWWLSTIAGWLLWQLVLGLWRLGSSAWSWYRARPRRYRWTQEVSRFRIQEDLAPAIDRAARILAGLHRPRQVSLVLRVAGEPPQVWQLEGSSDRQEMLLEILAAQAEAFVGYAAGLETAVSVELILQVGPPAPVTRLVVTAEA